VLAGVTPEIDRVTRTLRFSQRGDGGGKAILVDWTGTMGRMPRVGDRAADQSLGVCAGMIRLQKYRSATWPQLPRRRQSVANYVPETTATLAGNPVLPNGGWIERRSVATPRACSFVIGRSLDHLHGWSAADNSMVTVTSGSRCPGLGGPAAGLPRAAWACGQTELVGAAPRAPAIPVTIRDDRVRGNRPGRTLLSVRWIRLRGWRMDRWAATYAFERRAPLVRACWASRPAEASPGRSVWAARHAGYIAACPRRTVICDGNRR